MIRRALAIVAVAVLIVALIRLPARLTIDLSASAIEMPLSLAIGLLAVILLAAYWSISGLRWLLRGAQSHGARATRARRALARSQVAMAAGDLGDALRESGRALRLMPEDSAGGLVLQAEAAELDGNAALAADAYDRLAAFPETRFLGLRGKLRLALKANDRGNAAKLAAEAFALRPQSLWAADLVVALAAASGEVDLARTTIDKALKAKTYDRAKTKRRRALVGYFETLAAIAEGRSDRARQLSLDAHEQAPDHIAFAVVAAEAEASFGTPERGSAVLEATYALTPHPALVAALGRIFPKASAAERMTQVAALVRRRADHVESRLAMAETALANDALAAATRALRPLEADPGFRASLLLGRLAREKGEGGEAAARAAASKWFQAALKRLRDDLWSCSECGETAPDWTPTCPRCGALDAWIWPDAGSYAEGASGETARFVSETPRPPDDPGRDSQKAKIGFLSGLQAERPT